MADYPLSVMLTWVLIVPIVPAFLFQYVLPSKIDISGSLPGFLKGLNLKVVGGIAGYCFLVYIAWAVASQYLAIQGEQIQKQWERDQITKGPRYEEWNVKGTVTLNGPLGNTDHPIIALIPAFTWSPANEKNTFHFFGSVPIKRLDLNSTEIGYFKAFVISYENYSPATLDLREVKLTKGKPEITLPPIALARWKGGIEKEQILKRE